MATTTSTDVDPFIPELWSTWLFAEAENLTLWHNYEGPPGSSMPITRRDDLTAVAGDTIHIDIIKALEEDAIVGDLTPVRGNEEKLKYRRADLVVEQYSKGVKYTKKASKLQIHDMRQDSKMQLAKWTAGKLDTLMWLEITGNGGTTMPNANLWAAGTATTRATVADGNTTGRLTLVSITELRAYARTELKIEPIMTEDGNEYFILLAHPYAIMELKEFDTSWAQAQRDAQIRGDANPLFTGAAGLWDGVIIKESNRVPRSTNGTIQVADNVFLGANAASRGYAQTVEMIEDTTEDYGRQIGHMTDFIVGQKLNAFDLTSAGGAAASAFTAIGSLTMYTAAVAPSNP